jgi:hypothetical protein
MHETRNETNRRPVTCGRRPGPDALTFPSKRGVKSGLPTPTEDEVGGRQDFGGVGARAPVDAQGQRAVRHAAEGREDRTITDCSP